MVCSIHQPPSPSMRRRLAGSVERGWLLRLHRSDCSQVCGTVAWLDPDMQRCTFDVPDSLEPERDVFLDEVCDVEVLTVAMICAGRLAARLAVVAPWRGGSDDPRLIIADLMSGSAEVGQQGVFQLVDGVRRPGVIAASQGQRCQVSLSAD